MLICRALIKYGYSNFKWEVLEYCAPEVRFVRENYYIKVCSPEYNIVLESNTTPSRVGYIHKDSTKSLILLSQPARKMVDVTDTLTGQSTIFDSIASAAKFLNIKGTQISNYFLRNQVKPFQKRYIFKLMDKPVIHEKVDIIES